MDQLEMFYPSSFSEGLLQLIKTYASLPCLRPTSIHFTDSPTGRLIPRSEFNYYDKHDILVGMLTVTHISPTKVLLWNCSDRVILVTESVTTQNLRRLFSRINSEGVVPDSTFPNCHLLFPFELYQSLSN